MQIRLPKAVQTIIQTLNDAGFEAYAVGGCVRDALCGREPEDWDITTSALPEQTLTCFSGQRVIETGIKHGTVALLLDGELYEITTYRIDGSYADGRHPDRVSFVSSLREDLARRDFTVNAMAYHPDEGLIDPFGGQKDLKDSILRCVGEPEKRFTEDALRIMRAIRFASTLGFAVEAETADAVHRLKGQLDRIAKERIMTELQKLLCGQAVEAVLSDYSDVIFTIIPELAPTEGYYQNTPYHYLDVWGHTVKAVAEVQNDPILRLTMLLHDVAKPLCYFETVEYPYLDSDKELTIGHFKGHPAKGAEMVKAILKRLRCDHKTIQTVSELIFWHDERPAAKRVPVRRLLAKLGAERFLQLQEVRKADTRAQRPAYQAATLRQIEQVEQLGRELIAENACISIPQLAITGADMITLGIPQGKQIGEMLNRLLAAVVDEVVPNEREALLALAAKQ